MTGRTDKHTQNISEDIVIIWRLLGSKHVKMQSHLLAGTCRRQGWAAFSLQIPYKLSNQQIIQSINTVPPDCFLYGSSVEEPGTAPALWQ